MQIIAFVGASGTGKSYRAITIARENKIDAIIDDGLLISNNKIVAGITNHVPDKSLRFSMRCFFWI